MGGKGAGQKPTRAKPQRKTATVDNSQTLDQSHLDTTMDNNADMDNFQNNLKEWHQM